MLNYKRYRPFRRTYGWSFCLLSRYLASEAGLQRQVLPEPSGFRKCLGLMGSRGSSDLCGNLLYLWFYQWYRNFLLTGSGLHRNTWYAADRLRCLPCLHKRDSDRWISQCVHSSSKRKTLWRDPVPVPDRPCGWSCYVVHL